MVFSICLELANSSSQPHARILQLVQTLYTIAAYAHGDDNNYVSQPNARHCNHNCYYLHNLAYLWKWTCGPDNHTNHGLTLNFRPSPDFTRALASGGCLVVSSFLALVCLPTSSEFTSFDFVCAKLGQSCSWVAKPPLDFGLDFGAARSSSSKPDFLESGLGPLLSCFDFKKVYR